MTAEAEHESVARDIPAGRAAKIKQIELFIFTFPMVGVEDGIDMPGAKSERTRMAVSIETHDGAVGAYVGGQANSMAHATNHARDGGDLATRDIMTGLIPHDPAHHGLAVGGHIENLEGVAILGKHRAHAVLGAKVEQGCPCRPDTLQGRDRGDHARGQRRKIGSRRRRSLGRCC
jgi:hypothetical protein